MAGYVYFTDEQKQRANEVDLEDFLSRRGEKLLPQFDSYHNFNYVNMREGFFRFLWGAFKKLVLADRLAVVVDTVFAAPQNYGAIQVVVAACALVVGIALGIQFSASTIRLLRRRVK